MRFSVGAVNVRTGNSVYFDNTTRTASGPSTSWPAARCRRASRRCISTATDYWDGGIVSNTPLQYVLDMHPRTEALMVLQVDLFSARGPMPRTLSEVLERQKDITYSSRTRMNTDAAASNLNLEQALADLITACRRTCEKDPASKRYVRSLGTSRSRSCI